MITSELIPKIIAALESGNYKQSSGTLRKQIDGEMCYCVDGVILDVLDPGAWEENPVGTWYWNSHEYHLTIGGFIDDDDYLEMGFNETPQVFLEFDGFGQYYPLFYLNDQVQADWTFARFATWFRRNQGLLTATTRSDDE